MNLKKVLQQHIVTTLLDVELSAPPKPEMGDLALPCFQFAEFLKKSPAQIAKELAPQLINEIVIKAEAKGPYINLTLDPEFLAREVLEDYSFPVHDGKTIVVDYSSPNIAKHLGLHHLRSTMIGNAICNLYERTSKVIRLNYLGDWGTQFGVLLAACEKYGQRFDEQVTVGDLVDLYVQYSKEAKDNPELQEAARKEFQLLESEKRDLASKGIEHITLNRVTAPRLNKWLLFRKTSLEEFKRIYKRLDVGHNMVFQGESSFSEAAEKIVAEALEKGVAIESEGAIVVPMGENKSPCMLRKSDGATTYQSRDIAAAIAHYEKYQFDQKLYVVGHGQAQHFEQVFTTLKLLGYEWADRCKHIPFGLLRIEGSKFSSREGNIVLLEEALDVAKQEVANRIKKNDFNIPDEELDRIGMGAVIFADLSTRRIRDSSFKWEDVLKFEGNTGPYLQYTAVRCASIQIKSCKAMGKDIPELVQMRRAEIQTYGLLSTPEEKQILLVLADYQQAIDDATKEAEPSIVSHYLLRLAKATNRYIHEHRIIQEDLHLQNVDALYLQWTRTQLIDKVYDRLKSGLQILGIPVPDVM